MKIENAKNVLQQLGCILKEKPCTLPLSQIILMKNSLFLIFTVTQEDCLGGKSLQEQL